jgi:hypothetical protein
MAFITKQGDSPCYSCGKQCINVEFCSEGGEYSSYVSLSRNIRVSITANPEFWGFGGVLISGIATYSNGYYDFFNGFDEDHSATKECKIDAATTEILGPFKNEQRPDVFFRSVYDPDTGNVKNYGANGILESEGMGRGGAEVYLIDRPKGLIRNVTQDRKSCPETTPDQVFSQFPENFGWGNKIAFNTTVYKNLSAAWRMSSVENCYDNQANVNLNTYEPSGYLIDCSGEERQNIRSGFGNKFTDYEPTILKGSGLSNYYKYDSQCLPDGAVAGKYAGNFYTSQSLYRDTNISPFMQVKLSYGKYGGHPASGLKEGMLVGIVNEVSGQFNNTYRIFDVNVEQNYTNVKLVGTSTGNIPLEETIPTGNFSLDIPLGSGRWSAINTYDYETCCGLAAYGLETSPDNKQDFGTSNYHTDFRRVFNNPYTLRQSNRDKEWREYYNLYTSISNIEGCSGLLDYTYPSISGINISGVDYGFPIVVSGDTEIVVSGTELAIESGHALFERAKSYYGDFSVIDRYNNSKRFDQAINRGKSKNKTCYSKNATLEIFPDCITQYDKYKVCNEGYETYKINSLPRLAFVYRGCDFNDNCSFDDEKLPLGAWKEQGSVPNNIDDLKRQLGGQEIHMFINLGNALGGRLPGVPCNCDCEDDEAGHENPAHVSVPSPIRFTSFPNFDLEPEKYGCLDPRYQLQTLQRFAFGGVLENAEYCDTLHSSGIVCSGRQPYTTYGYIMNLCGKEDRNRKDVITKAFEKLHQTKEYTNENPGIGIDEPMYWSVTAPNPAPFFGGGIWGSGTTDRDDTNGVGSGFKQIAGQKYGYWGVADTNNQIVAPYFCTEKGLYKCKCDDIFREYVNYSTTGTFLNALNTHNGWPTDAVPFLIELEVDDSCVGCASAMMKNENLILELEGLSGMFLWNEQGKYYGHNYCSYRSDDPDYFRGKITPSWSCESGFDINICSLREGEDDEKVNKYGQYYDGNTCDCVTGVQEIVLNPVLLSGTDIVIGWRNGNADGSDIIAFSGCSDPYSNYLDVNYNIAAPGGYSIFGNFELACPNLLSILPDPQYPEAQYETNAVQQLWGNVGCSHHYPASIGNNGDLELKSTLFMVANKHVNTFRKFTQKALIEADLTQCPSPDNVYGQTTVGGDGWFGACPGDEVVAYGCWLGDHFYGCDDLGGGYVYTDTACTGDTLCNTCPTGIGEEGAIVCKCGSAIGYEGRVPYAPPMEYILNECFCKCKNPTPVRRYVLDSNNNLVITSGANDCAGIYWWSIGNSGPILTSCGPPNPYIGINLGIQTSIDWFDWSHGVNANYSRVRHELYQPLQGNDNDCNQLVKEYPVGEFVQRGIIDCEYTGCQANELVGQKTCGNPIFASGGVFENQVIDGIPLSDVIVRKKKCHPEVAIVNKIECIPNYGYKLQISREYHEHDRTWYEQIVIGDPPDTQEICIPVNVGNYRYDDGSTTGCQHINYSLLADSVTPAYQSPCSTHPSSGVYVGQDYKYQNSIFPSGSNVWNYFNLFYSIQHLPTVTYGALEPSIGRDESGNYHCDLPDLTIEDTGMVFSKEQYDEPVGAYGIFATNLNHSCVQELNECGGDLWCNKLFFPRHNYRIGTKIAPFGTSRLCTTTSEFKQPNALGYMEYGGIIDSAKDLIQEQLLSYYDWCDTGILTENLQPIDIDDTEIWVKDYLPLIGVIHPGWRFTTDVQSCTFGGSGCADKLPLHTEETILAGAHQPKTYSQNGFESMGYYLDRYGISSGQQPLSFIRASGVDAIGINGNSLSHDCIFRPFKIMIDVECNTNRIARTGFPIDSPTFLQGVQKWPSSACAGHIGIPSCQCSQTKCSFVTPEVNGTCQQFLISTQIGTLVPGPMYLCDNGFFCDPENPCQPGCEEIEGPFLKIGGSVEKYWHPNALSQAADIKGIVSFVSGECGGSECGGIQYYEYAYPPTPNDNWYQMCNGEYHNFGSETYSVVRLFQCKDNQYLNPHPADGPISIADPECACESEFEAGLCGAKVTCSDFSSCECNPIGPENIMAGSDFWFYDCDCEGFPAEDEPCTSTESLVKFTITEAG